MPDILGVDFAGLFVKVWLIGAAVIYAVKFFSDEEPDVFDCLFWPVKWLFDLLWK